LPAVHAQMVDQNIGQPLRKIISYRCSITLVFKVCWGSIEIFGDFRIQSSATRTVTATAPRSACWSAPTRTATWRRCASTSGSPTALRAPSGLEAAPRHVSPALRAVLAPCRATHRPAFHELASVGPPFSHLLTLKRSEAGYKGSPWSSPRVSTRSSVHPAFSLCSAACHHHHRGGAATPATTTASRRPQRPP
jgi:hypothetical protein